MSIYAISDLHLSLNGKKPMDIFGEIWRNHADRIAENWDAMVKPEDTVLIAGDSSWALKFEEAQEDLDYIAQRPGRKVMIRGNHDYWWRREATNRLQSQIDPSICLMHGRGIVVEGCGITGTRGWLVELEEDPDAGDERVMRREMMYLERGLEEIPPDVEKRIALLHYPPFNADLEPNEFADILQAHNVDILVYGHIHTGYYLQGDMNGTEYRLVSVDHVDFRPVLILET
jgi:predicted phosphohydrolase